VADATTAAPTRAGDSRPSLLPEDDLGRRGLFLMLAGWVFVLQAIHAGLRMLEDVMNGLPSWPVWAYSSIVVLSIIAAGLVFSSRSWGFYGAAAIAVLIAVWPLPAPTGGFVVFSGIELVLLALGMRAVGHPEAIQLAAATVPWRARVGVVQAVIAIVLVRVFLALEFDIPWIREHAWNIISKGLPLTLLISVIAIALAIVFALFGALARMSRNPVAYGLAGFYTSFFRGTPLIVQIFLIYFGLAEIGVRVRGTPLEPFGNLITLENTIAAIIAIGLNYGAYMTEIFRAGIQSVGHGQAEAADALGMSYGLRMRRIVLPQAVRVIIPPTGNEFIAMTKDSALAFTIGVLELFRRGDLAGREDFRGFEAYLIVAAVYWAMTGVLTFFQARLERKMGRGYVRAGEAGTKRTARKRTYLPTPAAQPGVTFVPGAGHGSGGGPGGAIFVTDDEGSTRSFGIDGTTSEPGRDEDER